ncbi:MAG TPA: xylulokinase [Solirubrobacterales bacterium]|nr:xylulokinase [Solirubrobacterales bacterium]
MERFVGVDVGTSGTKVVAIDREGRPLARAKAPHSSSHPRPGFSEQDPEDWVRSATRALGEIGPEPWSGLAFTGQMHGLVLLDGRGRVLRPAILWNDGRSAAERGQIEASVGRARLLDLVANLPIPGFTASSLLWVREHEPEVWKKARQLMLPKDYVRWRIGGGDPVTDVSDASGTLLFDVRRRRWSEEVVARLELNPSWLPGVVESTATVSNSGDRTPVAAGAGDQVAAALGVGLVAGGPIGISLGTSGVLAQLRAEPPSECDGKLQQLCAYSPDTWQTMGVTLAAGGSLAWWQSCCGGVDTYALLAEASGWTAGCDGLTFQPYLSGERAPHNDETLRGSFTGLAAHHNRGALTRAVVEGIACSLADVLDLIGPQSASTSARISGGLAESPLVREIIASVTGMSLELMTIADSTAYGAALIAGVAAGAFADCDEAAALCKPVGATDPVEADRDAYAEVLGRYRGLHERLSPLVE